MACVLLLSLGCLGTFAYDFEAAGIYYNILSKVTIQR